MADRLVAVRAQRLAQRRHLRGLVIDDENAGTGVVAHGCGREAAGALEAAASRQVAIKASRSSRSLGGLLSTRSTNGKVSGCSPSRWPQPVRRMTGVDGERVFTARATTRPSTRG